jgi:hypothetical protein
MVCSIHHIGILFASSVTVYAASCGTPPTPALVPVARLSPSTHPAVGCWHLEQNLWPSLHIDTLVLQLNSVAEDSVHLRLSLAPPDSSLRRWTSFSRWGIYEAHPDSVYVVLGDGLTGLALRLRVAGDVLNGRAYSFVDFSPAPRRSRAVSAVRIACKAAA